jgi:hypothetical protein
MMARDAPRADYLVEVPGGAKSGDFLDHRIAQAGLGLADT